MEQHFTFFDYANQLDLNNGGCNNQFSSITESQLNTVFDDFFHCFVTNANSKSSSTSDTNVSTTEQQETQDPTSLSTLDNIINDTQQQFPDITIVEPYPVSTVSIQSTHAGRRKSIV